MITEKEMTKQDMRRVEANGYLCRECQSRLIVTWSSEKNCFILRCSEDINHTGITRHDVKFENKLRRYHSMESTELMRMGESQMLKRVEMAKFPQELTVADKKLLAQVAITYGFDPLMGEISIYQGRPFVSIDGRYRKAQESGLLDGVETRPATEQERKDWGIPDGDYFFRAEVYVKGASHPFIGWGRVHSSETRPGSKKPGDTTSTFKPIQSNPQRMAEKRAEAQALRKAFHIPLPSIEDIGSPDYDIDSTAVAVNTTTGEIAEPKEPKPQKEKQVKAEEPVQETEEVTATESKIDLQWLKESLEQLQWTDCGEYLMNKYKVKGSRISEMVGKLTPEQQAEFVSEVQRRLDADR